MDLFSPSDSGQKCDIPTTVIMENVLPIQIQTLLLIFSTVSTKKKIIIKLSVANYLDTNKMQRRKVVKEFEFKHAKIGKKMLAEVGSLNVKLLSKKEVCKLIKFFKRESFSFLFSSC